ncbi:MAG: family 43 glycosylhydrolase [Bacteroidaceae bacterium]|nr:family 43 glycosylhydrolase [Bacteroidaceae bacterium]
MRSFFIQLMTLAVCLLTSVGAAAQAIAQTQTYTNPIISEDAPDPSIIKGNDGYYYLLSTAEHVYRSTDMVNWTYVRQAFGNNPRQQFVEGVDVYWAPCVTKQDGRYVLYFALSKWGGGDTASIGVAISDNPGGPYKLVGDGKLFTSGEVGVNNSIDPNYIEEDGHKYIVWGSWNGIWLIELTADGLAVKDINVKHQIAGTRFEAPYILKRGRYYYLFCSIGACCEGANSTYETVVGRATSLFGPYFSKDNKKMMDNNYSIFLTHNTACLAPGHNSRIIEDESGKTWITYHGYIRSNPDKGRVVWLDEVKWRNSWPYVTGNAASSKELTAPVVSLFSLDVDEVYPEWGVEQGALVPVDLMGDGETSLVVAGHRTSKEGVVTPWNAVLHKGSDGKWTTAKGGLKTGVNPTIVPTDLNGDGRLELVVLGAAGETSDASGNGIYVQLEDSSLLRADVQLDGADFTQLTAATVADVNHDGFPDIIAVGPEGRNVVLQAQVSKAENSFVFWARPFTTTSTTYTQVYSSDFNADGTPDLFACSSTTAELFLGDGKGLFTPTDWMNTCPVPADGGVAIADVNYDSALDIICSGEKTVVCLNDGTGHFTIPETSGLDVDFQNSSFSTSALNLFDWDGDNYADFLYQGESAALAMTTGAIWLGSNKGIFTPHRRFGTGSGAATTFLDWNGDQVKDIITTGTVTDSHLFPDQTGSLLAVTPNPSATSRRLNRLTGLQSEVDGNTVRLSWSRGQKNQTYEVFVRDDQGRLYGNVRAYTDGNYAGQRRVLDLGNCGTAIEAVFILPPGHYTWGVQRVNARYEGSPFATAEFTVTADGIHDDSLGTRDATIKSRYNILGQPVSGHHRGLQLLYYSDGSVRKGVSR